MIKNNISVIVLLCIITFFINSVFLQFVSDDGNYIEFCCCECHSWMGHCNEAKSATCWRNGKQATDTEWCRSEEWQCTYSHDGSCVGNCHTERKDIKTVNLLKLQKVNYKNGTQYNLRNYQYLGK